MKKVASSSLSDHNTQSSVQNNSLLIVATLSFYIKSIQKEYKKKKEYD